MHAQGPPEHPVPTAGVTATVKSHIGENKFLWLGLAGFGLVILFVNPLRETALEDDWAYALTVKHLVETGSYQLNDWLSANMPFQTYWGALFASVFGYSHAVLRVSTLVLSLAGLIAFYQLALEHGLNRVQAGLCVLSLMASPLVLRLSFNFDTDVPFLACLIITVLLYTKAIRRDSYPLMLAGAAAGIAAILTRQFGVALLAGLFVVWILGTERTRKMPLFLIGAIPPLGAAVWQFFAGTVAPNWGARYALHSQSVYFADMSTMLANLLWRPTVVLQYLALFSLPFVALALLRLAVESRAGSADRTRAAIGRRDVIILALFAAYIAAGIVYGHIGLGFPWLMPYLPWNFEQLRASVLVTGLLTAATSTGAVLLGWIIASRYRNRAGWNKVTPPERLIDLVTLFLLGQHLIFFKIGDQYLIGLLPFALIVTARHLGTWLDRLATATAAVTFAMLLACAIWVRGILVYQEARWTAAELIRESGIAPLQIYGSWTWNSYYTFQDYLREIDYQTVDDFTDYFDHWLPERERRAEFLVRLSATAPEGENWRIIGEVPFRDILFRRRSAYAVQRLSMDR